MWRFVFLVLALLLTVSCSGDDSCSLPSSCEVMAADSAECAQVAQQSGPMLCGTLNCCYCENGEPEVVVIESFDGCGSPDASPVPDGAVDAMASSDAGLPDGG